MVAVDKILGLAEILLGYFQYLTILIKLDIDWPSMWKAPLEWLKITALDIKMDFISLPNFDYRSYYLGIVVVLPLLISLVSLIFFKSFAVLVWYFSLLLGLCAMVAGTYGLAAPNISLRSAQVTSARGFLILGSIAVFFCIIVAIVQMIRRRAQLRETVLKARRKINRLRTIKVADAPADKVAELLTIEEKERAKLPIADINPETEGINGEALEAWTEAQKMKQVKTEPSRSVIVYLICFLLVIGLLLVALFSFGALPMGSVAVTPSATINNSLQSFTTFTGVLACIAIVLVVLYVTIITLPIGRKILKRIRSFFDEQFIRIIFFVLLVAYIPITNVLLTSWQCADVTCPVGSHLPFKSSGSSVGSLFVSIQNTSSYCVPCTFVEDNCTWTGNNTDCKCSIQLCQETTESRLKNDVGVSCKEVQSFFGPIAVIMGIAIVLGVPVMYYWLIKYHAHFLQQLRVKGVGNEERWKLRTAATNNSARSLYITFEHKWRYFKVMLLVQKLVVVIAAIFMAIYPFALSICLLVVYFSFFVVNSITQPYTSRIMDLLSTASSFALVVSALLSVLVSFEVAVPGGVSLTIVILNYVLPILAVVLGLILEIKMDLQARKLMKKVQDEKTKEEDIGATTAAQQSPAREDMSPRTMWAMDWQLNRYTIKYMTWFMIVVGALGFICLTIGLIGMFAKDSNSKWIQPTDTPTTQADSASVEYVGYSNWEEFASNCCCFESSDNTTTHNRIETWQCRNGFYKLRNRVVTTADGVVLSGLALRPFCHRNFNTSMVCDLTFKPTGRITADLCSGQPDLDETILTDLW